MPTSGQQPTSLLKMDASDLIKAFQDSTKSTQDFNKEIDVAIKVLNSLGVSLTGTTITMTKTAEGGQKMAAAIGNVEGEITRLNTSVKITNQQILQTGKGIEVATQNAANYKDVTIELNAALLQNDSAQEKVQARLREQNRLAAQLISSQLQKQFITPSPATPNEIAKVSAGISRINQLVLQGAISIQQALTIVQQVGAGTGDVYTGVASKVAAAALQITNSQKKLGSQFIKETDDIDAAAKKTGRNLSDLFSPKNLGRLVIFQVLHDAVRRLSSALKDSVTDAAEFQVRISEIRTISLENQLSFEGWSAAVRGLSDQFGKPIDDVARGTYELISNQVAAGTDAVLLMQKAMVFAQVAVTSTANAVNILSSAIKGYNLNQTEADIILAQFFKTIELGRVRADDLANTIGRIVPLASTLGVDLANLNAAIATLSVQGITPSESLTAIQGVLTKLLRPTKEMTKLFNEWGVSTGKAAIATFGFEGVLKRLARAAEDGDTEIGQLFNEIRGTRGFLGLTNTFDTFSNNLREIKASAFGDYIKAQLISSESAGRTFQIEMNKVKNFFIDDFGKAVLELVVSLTKLGGTTHSLTDFFGTLKVAGFTLLETFIAYKTLSFIAPLFTAMAAEGAILAGVQRSLALSVGKVTAAVGIGIFVYQRWAQAAEESAQFHGRSEAEIAKAVEDGTKAQALQLNLRTQAVTDGITKQFQTYLEHVSEVNKLFNQLTESQKKATKLVSENMKNTFDLTVKSIESRISSLKESTNQAAANIKKANEQLFEAQEGLVRGRFERQVKLAPEDQQAKLLLARADAANKTANALLTAKTGDAAKSEENLTKATKERQEADRLNNDLLDRRVAAEKKVQELLEKVSEIEKRTDFNQSITNQADKIRDLRHAIEDAKTPPRRRNAARTELQSELRAAADEEVANREDESGRRLAVRLADLKSELSIQQNILKTLPTREGFEKRFVDATKQQKTALEQYIQLQNQIKRNAEELVLKEQAKLEILKDSFRAFSAFKVTDKITDFASKSKFLEEFDARLKEAKTSGGLIDQSVLKSIIDQRTQLEEQANIQIEKHRTGLEEQGIQKKRDALIKDQKDIADKQIQLIQNQKKGFETALNLIEESRKTEEGATIRGSVFGIGSRTFEIIATLGPALQKFNEDVKTLSPSEIQKQAFALRDLLGGLVDTVAQRSGKDTPQEVIIKQGVAGTTQGQRTLGDVEQDFRNAIQQIIDSAKTQKELNAGQLALANAFKTLNIKPQEIKPLDSTTADINKFGQAYINSISNTVSSIQTLNKEIDETARRLRNIVPTPAGIPQTRSHGGSIFWRARGMDTVPAMLRPGEFIVNADATRRNIVDLMAMNSGKQMRYMASGGLVTASPVTQTISRIQTNQSIDSGFHMGDVNVEINSTGDSKLDGRLVGEVIRREIYAGRLTIPNNRRKS